MRGSEWELAGPRRFAQGIADDIYAGRSVIVGLPSSGVPEGLRAAVRELRPELDVNHLNVADIADGRHTVLQRLFERLDLGDLWHADDRLHVGHLCENPKFGRRLIWVDCRQGGETQVAAWGNFLTQYSAAASAIDPRRRAVFGTICQGRGMTLLPSSDRQIATHWWWGVVSPLDTALHVAEQLEGRNPLPSFAESVTEVAGFDLELATKLTDSWGGSPGQLPELLTVAPAVVHGLRWSNDPSPNPFPPPDSLDAWCAGVVNAWGEMDPHLHPVLNRTSLEDLAALVWRAQVGYLMPKIEMQRQVLARWLHDHRDQVAKPWSKGDILGLEIGGVSQAMSESPALGRHRDIANRAHWLRATRNKIAHLEVLELPELERARRVFARPHQIPSDL
jgi:hypothetical protein